MSDNEQCCKKGFDQTRDRLILSGLNLLVKKGYRGAVTREIASGAGVTEVTLYRHFRSKDELFATAVIEQGEKLLSVIPEPSGDMEADLLVLSVNLVTQISSNFVQLIRIVPEFEEHGLLRDQINTNKERFRAKLLSLINHYQTPTTHTNYSDMMIYYAFIGPILSFSLDAANGNGAFDSKQHVKLFLEGRGS